MTRTCPSCGADIGAGDHCCPSCGRPLETDGVRDPYQPSEELVRDQGGAPAGTAPSGGNYGIPFGATESIGVAFSQWARNLGRLVLLSLIPLAVIVPLGIVVGVLVYLTVTDSDYLAPLVGSIVVLVLAILPVAVASGAGSYLILDDQALGGARGLGVWQAFGMGFRYFWRLLGAGILVALAMAGIAAVPVAVGFLLLPAGILLGLGALVLMIWLGVRWIAVWPAIVIEDIGAIEAFGRSRSLTRGSFWSIFGTLVLMFLIFLGIGIVLGLLGLIPIIGQLVNLAANVLLGPLSLALVFGIYAGLRDRISPSAA